MNRNENALARDMRNVVSDVEALLRDASAAGSGTAGDLRSRVGYAMQVARDRLDSLDANVRTNARRAATATDEYVHDSPWQAIGVGMLIGLAAGALLMRRW